MIVNESFLEIKKKIDELLDYNNFDEAYDIANKYLKHDLNNGYANYLIGLVLFLNIEEKNDIINFSKFSYNKYNHKAIEYFKEAIKHIDPKDKYYGLSLRRLSICNNNINNKTQALKNINDAKLIFEDLNDSENLASVYGTHFYLISNNEKTNSKEIDKYFSKAEELCLKNEYFDDLSYLYGHYAYYLLNKKSYLNSINYSTKSIQLIESKNIENKNIGIYYVNKGYANFLYSKSLSNIKSKNEYLNKSLEDYNQATKNNFSSPQLNGNVILLNEEISKLNYSETGYEANKLLLEKKADFGKIFEDLSINYERKSIYDILILIIIFILFFLTLIFILPSAYFKASVFVYSEINNLIIKYSFLSPFIIFIVIFIKRYNSNTVLNKRYKHNSHVIYHLQSIIEDKKWIDKNDDFVKNVLLNEIYSFPTPFIRSNKLNLENQLIKLMHESNTQEKK